MQQPVVNGHEKSHPVDINVGVRIRQRRKAIKVSQQELAAKVGVTFQQIQKYERGANRVSASKLWEISNVLRVPISWFFNGMDCLRTLPGAANDVHAFLSTHEAIDLGQAYISLPSDEQRRRVLGLLTAMAS